MKKLLFVIVAALVLFSYTAIQHRKTTNDSGITFTYQVSERARYKCDGGLFGQKHVWIPVLGCYYNDPAVALVLVSYNLRQGRFEIILLHRTHRQLVKLTEHHGNCDSCGTPLEIDEPIIGVAIVDNDELLAYVPIDVMECPECHKIVEVMKLYKTVDITQEIEKIKK